MRVVLFARSPVAGQVKTRLIPLLGSRGALVLYQAFLADQLALLQRLRAVPCQVELSLDGPGDPAGIPGFLLEGVTRTEQGPGDLGERLLHAAARCAAHGPFLFMGADSPTLPEALALLALEQLERDAQAVVSPAEDGGYVLLGLREASPALFESIPWGGPEVLEHTRERARRARIPLVEIPSWYDVDDAAGLARLEIEMRDASARRRAPFTARCLSGLARG